MGKNVEFTRPDGKRAPGFYLEGEGGKKAPGVVLIQEWWGVNDHMKSVGEWLAEEDFRVLIPDLYRGKVTQDSNQANQWMEGLNFPDACHQEIRGAVQYLKQDSAKVGALGFCMGGALTVAASVHVPELDAAVCFYGIPPKQFADPAQIRVPIQFHFANRDDWCNPAAVAALDETLKACPVKFELYRYDAQHAFFNDSRPEVYDPDAAQVAWNRTIKFLKANLA